MEDPFAGLPPLPDDVLSEFPTLPDFGPNEQNGALVTADEILRSTSPTALQPPGKIGELMLAMMDGNTITASAAIPEAAMELGAYQNPEDLLVALGFPPEKGRAHMVIAVRLMARKRAPFRLYLPFATMAAFSSKSGGDLTGRQVGSHGNQAAVWAFGSVPAITMLVSGNIYVSEPPANLKGCHLDIDEWFDWAQKHDDMTVRGKASAKGRTCIKLFNPHVIMVNKPDEKAAVINVVKQANVLYDVLGQPEHVFVRDIGANYPSVKSPDWEGISVHPPIYLVLFSSCAKESPIGLMINVLTAKEIRPLSFQACIETGEDEPGILDPRASVISMSAAKRIEAYRKRNDLATNTPLVTQSVAHMLGMPCVDRLNPHDPLYERKLQENHINQPVLAGCVHIYRFVLHNYAEFPGSVTEIFDEFVTALETHVSSHPNSPKQRQLQHEQHVLNLIHSSIADKQRELESTQGRMAQIKARRDELCNVETSESYEEQCTVAEAYVMLCKEQRAINDDVVKKKQELQKQQELSKAMLESHEKTIQDLRHKLGSAQDQIESMEQEKIKAIARHKRQKTAHVRRE